MLNYILENTRCLVAPPSCPLVVPGNLGPTALEHGANPVLRFADFCLSFCGEGQKQRGAPRVKILILIWHAAGSR